MVLAPIEQEDRRERNLQRDEGHTINDVRRLYRKNFPLIQVPPLHQVLKYNVPYIDHFFTTLRFDTKRMVQPGAESDFISFESI
jgi:hypothetical protein